MKVIQSLNQNALLVRDESGHEFITLGKGIGFGLKKGDEVEKSKITTIYSIKSTIHEQKILEQLKDIDENVLIMAEEVGKMANEKLTDELNESFVFSLANHLQYSIERNMSQDIPLQPFHHEIKYLYPKEYVLAECSVDYLNDKYQLALHESEKAFFTLHFVNGLKDSANFQETVTLSNILNDIVMIIERESECELDKTSVDYSRFIVHLRYFLIRQMQTPTITSEEESNLMELYQSSASLFTKQRDIVQKLKVFLDEQHSMAINHAEAFYLLIHLIRVLDQ
ncbi:PRD domain-containing protein [Fundicoccus sp. Sow4_F4]|uniref:PRD domain-containing protein n=1 Tax=Fundicoccus sp. Sow4_F4 TaxID=3438783 RepID=UPI003F91EF31